MLPSIIYHRIFLYLVVALGIVMNYTNFLNRFFAINSFLNSKNRINEYEVHGGTVILGTNTKGKTSTLRIPLIFMGTDPRAIANLARQKNINDFYYSRNSSYLAFEYQSNDSKNLVVTCSNKKRISIDYYFVTGEYDERLFLKEIDGQVAFTQSEDFKRTAKVMGREVFGPFNHREYADIIQDGRLSSGFGKNRDWTAKLRQLRPKFSLCPEGSHIRGMDKIGLSIIDSSPSLNTIKGIVANDIQETVASVNESIASHSRHSKSEQSRFDATVVKQYEEFKETYPQIEALYKTRDTVLLNRKSLQGLKFQAIALRERFEPQIQSLIDSTSTLNKELANEKDDFTLKRDKTKQNQMDAKFKLENLIQSIQSLEKQYQWYVDDDIESKGVEARSINVYESQIGNLQAQINIAKESYENIINLYENQLRGFKDMMQSRLDDESQIISNKIEVLQSEIEDLHAEFNRKSKSIQDGYDESRDLAQKALEKLHSDLASKQALHENPQSDRLTKLKLQESLLIKQRDEQQSDLLTLERQKSENQSDLNQTSQNIKDKTYQLESQKFEEAKIRDEIESLNTDLNRIESMLYFKVMEQSPEKAEILSQIAREEVLKTNVPGQLNVHTGKDILGIDFDFSQFDSIRPQNKEDTELSLGAQSKNLDKIQREIIPEIEKEIRKLNYDKNAKNKTNDELGLAINKAQNKLNGIVDELKTIQGDIQIESSSIIDSIKSDIEETQASINLTQSNMRDLKIQRDEQLEELKKFNEEQRISKRKQIEAHKKKLNDFETQIKQEINEKEAELEKAKQSELQGKGADTDFINRIESQLEEKIKSLEKAKDYLKDLQKYEIWMESEYIKLSDYKSQQVNVEENQRALEKQLSALESNFEKSRLIKQSKLSNQDKNLNSLKSQVFELDTILSPTNSTMVQIQEKHCEEFDDYDVDKITRWLVKYIEDNRELEKEGRKGLNWVMRKLSSKTELYKLSEELLTEYGLNDMQSTDWIESLKSLRWIIGSNGTLEEVIQSKINSFLAISQQLQNLNTELNNIEKEINSVGKRVTKHLNESARQFEGVNGLKANIYSIISQERFKKELEDVCSKISKNAGRTPDSGFIQMIANSLHILNQDISSIDLNKMIKVSVELEKADGTFDVAETDAALEKISSEGMSFLILVMLFVSIKHSILKRKDIELLWSMDEVGRIHSDNVQLISDILKEENISFMCAGPEINDKVANMFNHLYEIKWSKEHQSDMITKYEPEKHAVLEFDDA